ncbi:glycosyltransferase family 4 protein [Leptonema illini]|uniref:Glycosyl transferase group 1 n=1 Tax=Leptonema illini DSM 21528 TaxID=929563 RepID=H2CD46_9LEPT|nr:glycosyltransferase family 4 protein [Leptonema illini]EHQ07522.1 glycosyl transferase group 1 [Leptonema illini DSM 21528]
MNIFKLFKANGYNKKIAKEKVIIVDSTFPQLVPFGFRNREIAEYLRSYDFIKSYTMPRLYPDKEAWFSHPYGMTFKQFKTNKEKYLEYYPEIDPGKIQFFHSDACLGADLSYSFFLAETYTLLPLLEKNKIPFVFVLYPGGAFGIDFDKSDIMLQRIFSSEYFRKVIVTQEITKKYLLSKSLCHEDSIEYIYGGFIQFDKNQIMHKKKYQIEKKSFDICFVAAKYSDRGVDKGYDLFIECAKILCRKYNDIYFHIVGNWDKDDIDVSDIEDRVFFYGLRRPDFFPEFYSSMDIFLSPNRPFKLFPGNFDGFPLGADASFHGVALFLSDELKINTEYDSNEIVIVNADVEDIVSKINYYYDNIDQLYRISYSGQYKTHQLFSTELQIEKRIKIFENFIER